MDATKSKHSYMAVMAAFLLLVAASYGPATWARDEADDAPKSTSVSSFLNQVLGRPDEIAGEPNETVAEPREMIAEREPFEENIWYAGTWDSTLYLNTRYPRTVAIKMKLLDQETRLPINGAGVSIKGEYEQTLTGPDIRSQVDLSIFHDLRNKKTLRQQRKFGLDAISDSKGFVVFALNWQKEYSWQEEAGDEASVTKDKRVIIHPDNIRCVVSARIGHPECKAVEIPVAFKRENVKPIMLDLGEKFSDFNNPRSRRMEFFEKVRAAADVIVYADAKKLTRREHTTRCGPYLVYDLGEILLECTAPRKQVSPPGTISTKETPDTSEPQPSREKRPPEQTVKTKDRTVPDAPVQKPEPQISEKPAERQDQKIPVVSAKTQEPKEPLETIDEKASIAQQEKPDQKSIEQPEPVTETIKADDGLPAASHTQLEEKIIALGDGVAMRFQLVPKGEFQMGSSPDEWGRDADEGPVPAVRIDQPFYMGMYELTQEQYEKVMGTNPSKYQRPQYPVHMVSWNDAQAFCRRMSSLIGEPIRLPTEAEWEYACRAGTTTAYYWGDRFDDRYAWSLDNSKDSVHEVGTRLPNAWGLYDMSGNLWEWCENEYDEHDLSSVRRINRIRSSLSADRVLRGGSWNVKSLFCRSANRSRNRPDVRMDYNGFRVVMDVK